MKFSDVCPALFAVAAVLRPSALAFTAVPGVPVRGTAASSHGTLKAHEQRRPAASARTQVIAALDDVAPATSTQATRTRESFEGVLRGAVLATATGFAGASGALAEYVDPDDVGELVTSDLPPMWVPLAVGVVLALGIGLLQGSLGDVMNDEAKLGALSGARAAKQSARDRDMFKKKDQK